MIEQCASVLLGCGQVVHACRDNPDRPGHEFGRPAALRPVPAHIVHFAAIAVQKPLPKTTVRLAQIDVTDPDLLEAEIETPLSYVAAEREQCFAGRVKSCRPC